MGGGDILMSFLGVVILSFGFRIFGQRRLMKRHAPEIFGSTTISSLPNAWAMSRATPRTRMSPSNRAITGRPLPMPSPSSSSEQAMAPTVSLTPRAVREHLAWLISPNVLPFPVHIVSAGDIRADLLRAGSGARKAARTARLRTVARGSGRRSRL